MSKPKPRASEITRSTPSKTKPVTTRKVSEPVSGTKFYTGPTVPATEASKSELKPRVSAATVVPKDKNDKNVTSARSSKTKHEKRSRFGILSLITFVPFLLFISLFSTVLCPPPNTSTSSFSRIALNRLGLGKESKHQSLHEKLCYPANVYHKQVLQPYVYPVLEDVQAKIHGHPVYVQHIAPAYTFTQAKSQRLWNGPIKPIVDRIARGARRFYLTYVEPHLPYVHAKATEATAPLINRVKLLHKTYLEPHVAKGQLHATSAWNDAKHLFETLSSHPVTLQADRHARSAIRLGRHHGYNAYVASRPHAIRWWQSAKEFTRDVAIPRAVELLRVLGQTLCKGLKYAKIEIAKLYNTHAAEHVDPYITKVRDAVEPYSTAVHQHIYKPYVYPLVIAIAPELAEPKKTFWDVMSEKLAVLSPSTLQAKLHKDVKQEGTKPASTEQVHEKQNILQREPKVDKQARAKPASDVEVQSKKAEQEAVPEPVAEELKKTIPQDEKPVIESKTTLREEVVTPVADSKAVSDLPEDKVVESQTVTTTVQSSVTGASQSADTVTSADVKVEIDAAISALQKRVEYQGKSGLSRLQNELGDIWQHVLDQLPDAGKAGRDSILREIDRMVSGLDRLYTRSETLTREQVAESLKMSESKVNAVRVKMSSHMDQFREDLKDKIQPGVDKAQSDIQRVLGAEYKALGEKLAAASRKEHAAYIQLQKDVDAWKAKYAQQIDKPATRKLRDLKNEISTKISEINMELKDFQEGFRERQEKLKTIALDRISAREEVAKEKARQARVARAQAKKAAPTAAKPASESTVAKDEL